MLIFHLFLEIKSINYFWIIIVEIDNNISSGLWNGLHLTFIIVKE